MLRKLNEYMRDLKKLISNANWENLLTGIAVLAMVVVFSYVYFSKSDYNTIKQEVEKPAAGGLESVPGNSVSEAGTDGKKDSGSSGTTIVQKGEGLWHVAQRVCGDGEKYNILAQANGLYMWEELNEGMTLKIICN